MKILTCYRCYNELKTVHEKLLDNVSYKTTKHTGNVYKCTPCHVFTFHEFSTGNVSEWLYAYKRGNKPQKN